MTRDSEPAMGTLRQVRRATVLPAPPARVWAAVTERAQLAAWLGVELTGELVPGAVGTARAPGDAAGRAVRVETVDVPRRLSFAWWPEDEDVATGSLVELRLDEAGDGTRLTVRETAVADLVDDRGGDRSPVAADGGR